MIDNVNHPQHYECLGVNISFTIEPINLCSSYDFNLGNAIKYILRAQYKGNEIEDLKKAIWYLKFLKKVYIEPTLALNDGIIFIKALEIYKKKNRFIDSLINLDGTCNYRNRRFTIKRIKERIKELENTKTAANDEVTEVSELIKED